MLWGRTRRSTCGTCVVGRDATWWAAGQEMLGRQAAGGKHLRGAAAGGVRWGVQLRCGHPSPLHTPCHHNTDITAPHLK